MVVDSSGGDSICALIMQDGNMVMCTSRTLTPTERKYHIIEKEMLAVKYGCKKFRVHILGRPTVVLTDHKPLLGDEEARARQVNRRLMAYKNDISEFTLRPEHVPGKENKSDFWTRLGLGPESDSKVCVVGEYGAYPNPERDSRVCLLRSMDVRMNWNGSYSRADLRELEDFGTAAVRTGAVGKEILVRGTWRLFVPGSRRRALCWLLHRERHQGVAHMLDALVGYHWPRKKQDVRDFVASCACTFSKEGRPPRNKAFKSITADAPMELVAIDVFAYDDEDNLTVMDVHSGMPFVYDLPNGHTQEEVHRAFEHFESAVGEPGRLLSDRGHEFGLIRDYPFSRTAAYHPEGNSVIEHFHKELANLCHIHKCSPMEAVKYYRTPEMRRVFYARGPAEENAISYGSSGRVIR